MPAGCSTKVSASDLAAADHCDKSNPAGAQGGPDEVPADADPATLEAVDVSQPAGRTAQAGQGPSAAQGRDAGGDDRSDATHQPTEVSCQFEQCSRHPSVILINLSCEFMLAAVTHQLTKVSCTIEMVPACRMLLSQVLRGGPL